ncbi:MAG TPA: glycoside hydrolase family 36 protein [Myxococcota bacterium]|nr:glycoside hydrolase family 36 protein [Myxococcota bacterium]
MAVTIQREETAVSLANERVRARLELAPARVSLFDPSGAVGVAGARLCAWVDGQPREGTVGGTRVVASLVRDLAFEDEVDTPLGRAARVRARIALAEGLELGLALELGAGWPGVVLGLELHNVGPAPRAVAALEPFAWQPGAGARLALPGDPEALAFLALGYQSWSPARWLRLGERPPAPRRFVRRVFSSPFAPQARRGRFVSDSACALGVPGRTGLALGFASHSRWSGWIEAANARGRLNALDARCATDGAELAPGQSLSAERLWLGLAAPVEEALAQWAERAGREMAAPVPARSLAGWCSWYRFGTRVRAEDVSRNLRALRELPAKLDVVQIDDGFQSALGDWLTPAAGFPEGLAPLAREIRAEGYRPGLWLAPFLAAPRSRLAREKPEWLLRGASGRPLTALWNPDWPGRRALALDATQPAVEAWLESLGRELRALGFDYLKLDFLFAGALAGKRHDPRASGVQAYRRGIAALRRGVGPGVFLLGCGAPLGPSIGLFEGMRIGPDVAARWRNPGFDRVLGLPSGPSARNSLANVLARAPLHQRLWLNDPDCVLLREAPSQLDAGETRTLAAAIALSGGLVVVSDELSELSSERRRWLERMLPALSRAPSAGPARAGLPDELVTRFDDGSALWLRVNLGERDARVDLDPAALGLRGPLRVWDVFAERELGRGSGEMSLGTLPPHGARLLRLVPDDGARVVGTTLHWGAGALEAEPVAMGPAGEARVRLKLAGRREGEIAVALPGSPRLTRAHVAFDDALELGLRVGGVVNPGEIAD